MGIIRNINKFGFQSRNVSGIIKGVILFIISIIISIISWSSGNYFILFLSLLGILIAIIFVVVNLIGFSITRTHM